MKYFLDTEFIEDGKTIDLISIGIACEDGREYYAQNLECEFKKASDWVKGHVFPHLKWFNKIKYKPDFSLLSMPDGCPWNNPWLGRSEIKKGILKFIGKDTPEFWGYYSDYDWVVFCQLFGKMIDLPKSWPMYCRDLKQCCDQLGNPDLPSQESNEHHALADAKWNKDVYNFLEKLKN